MKKKLLAFLLLASGLAFGQQRQTVFLNLAQGLTTTGNVTYSVTNNIGQNYHTFVIYAPQSVTCTSGVLATYAQNTTAQIEASYDGVIYNVLPQVRTSYSYDSVNQSAAKYYRAAGAYPYIRIRLLNILSTCSNGVGYTGLLQANPLSDANNPYVITQFYVGGTCEYFHPITTIGGVPSGYTITGIQVLAGATNPTGTGIVTVWTSNLCTSGSVAQYQIGQVVSPDPTGASLFNIPPNTSMFINASNAGVAVTVWYELEF